MIMGQGGTFDLANPESRLGKRQFTAVSSSFSLAHLSWPRAGLRQQPGLKAKSWFSRTLRAVRHLQEQLGPGAAVWVGKEAFCCSGAATIFGEIAHTNHFATILL